MLGPHGIQNTLNLTNRVPEVFQRILKLVGVHMFTRTDIACKVNPPRFFPIANTNISLLVKALFSC
jgi:hypothetical protein